MKIDIRELTLEGFLFSKVTAKGFGDVPVLGPPRIDGRELVNDFLELLSPASLMDLESQGPDIWTLVGACIAWLDHLPPSVAVSELTRRDFARALKTVPLTDLTLKHEDNGHKLFHLTKFPTFLA